MYFALLAGSHTVDIRDSELKRARLESIADQPGAQASNTGVPP